MTLNLYGYKKLYLTIKRAIADLTDPDTDENLYKNVAINPPENLGLYNGPLAVLLFGKAKRKSSEIGLGKEAMIKAAVLTFIPGENEAAALKCVHNCDIIEAYLDTSPINGIQTIVDDDNSQDWKVVDVGTDKKKPKKCTAGGTLFTIIKSKERGDIFV